MSAGKQGLVDWVDLDVVDKDDHKIGKVANMYKDDETNEPKWLAVVIVGVATKEMRFVPAKGATCTDDVVKVAYSVEEVELSPDIDPEDHLSRADDAEIHEYYQSQPAL